MKAGLISAVAPSRWMARIQSELRYLRRLLEQVHGIDTWDERLAAYEEYRNAHERLMRVTRLHGIAAETLPPLTTMPARREFRRSQADERGNRRQGRITQDTQEAC